MRAMSTHAPTGEGPCTEHGQDRRPRPAALPEPRTRHEEAALAPQALAAPAAWGRRTRRAGGARGAGPRMRTRVPRGSEARRRDADPRHQRAGRSAASGGRLPGGPASALRRAARAEPDELAQALLARIRERV